MLLLIGFVSGIIFWGGFNTGTEEASTEELYISCHKIRNMVYQEYAETVYYSNRNSVRATCPDCHVPHEWGPKTIRKIKANKELYAKALGLIDTLQKFEDHHLAMAQSEQRRMKDNSSQKYRNCHSSEFMDLTAQGGIVAKMYDQAVRDRQTCIDCHKGMAHELSDMYGVGPGS